MPEFPNHEKLGVVRQILNSTGLRQNEFAAVRAPVESDDERFGWEVGSYWYFNGTAYVCKDATQFVAVWEPATDAAVVDIAEAADEKATASQNPPFTPYDSYAAFIAANVPAPLDVVSINVNGTIIKVTRNASGTVRQNDGTLWAPADRPTPQHWGSFGALKSKNPATPYLLSDMFTTLSAAQAFFPKASALTETIDDMAFQAMVDWQRSLFFDARGIYAGGIATGNNIGQHTFLRIPFGVYYLTRPVDFTGINTGHNFWGLHGEGAVIMVATPGKPGLDLTSARKCAFSGVGTIIGVWTSGGVPRCGIQFGRDATGVSADCHAFPGTWDIKGRFSLGGVYNYAAEDMRFGNLAVKNDLDPLAYHCDFAGSDGSLTFVVSETVTWDAGASTGTIKYRTGGTTSGEVVIRHLTGTAPGINDEITGATSGKVATISVEPVKEPAGEGRNGESYCIVQDGSNKWGLQSDYRDNPAVGTTASFLQNGGDIDCRHTGLGSAMWMGAQATMHDWGRSYLVATNGNCASVVVDFTHKEMCNGFVHHGHNETDLNDGDPATGLRNYLRMDSDVVRAKATLLNWGVSDNFFHSSGAIFNANEGNITEVDIIDGNVDLGYPSRLTEAGIFVPQAKFLFQGRLAHFGPVANKPNYDINGIRGFVGELVTDDRNDVATTNGQAFTLTDATGSYDHNVKSMLSPNNRFERRIYDAAGAEVAHWRWNNTSGRWELIVGGTLAVAYNASGLLINGVKVLGPQAAAIADDASGAANQATVNMILARLRTHGLIAT